VTGPRSKGRLSIARHGAQTIHTANTPLPLLTNDQREQLLANGPQSGRDHVPVVKFFNPVGIGTWLATELDADGDILFGMAQLNDAPELGFFSLEELARLELPFGNHGRVRGPARVARSNAQHQQDRHRGSPGTHPHPDGSCARMLEALRKAGRVDVTEPR
jgi:hypothetical protein